MPIEPLAVLILVLCALAWSSFDLARKILLDTVDPVPLVFLLAGLQAPLFAVWNAVGEGVWTPTEGYLLPAALSVGLNVVANVLFVVAIKISPLSLTIPLLSLTPVFTSVLAIPMLGEVPGPWEWVGIVLVVIGAMGLHMVPDPSGRTPRPAELWRAFLREKGSVMMAAVALMWSIAPPLDKMAMARSGAAFHGMVLSAGVAAGLGLLLAGQGRLRSVAAARQRPGMMLAALAASALALAFQLVAIRMVLVSVVETVKRGLGNAVAVALGAAVFEETVGRWQWAAAVLMGVGVAFILL